MNVNDYKVQIPYPSRIEFIEVLFVTLKDGKTQKRVECFDDLGFERAKKDYLEEGNRLYKKFFEDLKVYLGITNNPKADLLLLKAREHGDAGMKGILDWAEEMVDLIC